MIEHEEIPMRKTAGRAVILAWTICGVIMATGMIGCFGSSDDNVVEETEPVKVRPPKSFE